jgi:ubiquinone/menaquinone biosynthesis C-methylase UbiE
MSTMYSFIVTVLCFGLNFLQALEHHQVVNEEFIAKIWDKRAEEWDLYIGDKGERDPNRVYQSDPVLWEMLKDINGLIILDLGCGEGYLSRELARKGADVIAIDISEKLIEIAKKKSSNESIKIDYRVESSNSLKSVPTETIDRVVSNYVLMDVPDFEKTIQELHRVLKSNGEAVLVFSHPCFPMYAIEYSPDLMISYGWKIPYFKDHLMKMPRWRDFTEGFTIFHRPLSKYWKTFLETGFEIVDFDEPLFTETKQNQMSKELVDRFTSMPHSVAFLLRKK